MCKFLVEQHVIARTGFSALSMMVSITCPGTPGTAAYLGRGMVQSDRMSSGVEGRGTEQVPLLEGRSVHDRAGDPGGRTSLTLKARGRKPDRLRRTAATGCLLQIASTRSSTSLEPMQFLMPRDRTPRDRTWAALQ